MCRLQRNKAHAHNEKQLNLVPEFFLKKKETQG